MRDCFRDKEKNRGLICMGEIIVCFYLTYIYNVRDVVPDALNLRSLICIMIL